PAIGSGPRERLAAQARLQLAERVSGVAGYELLPAEPGRGVSLLPEPSPGDLFFDIEGDPYVGDTGLEYLFGIRDSAGAFTAYWGHNPAGEKAAFEGLVDHLVRAWAADPAMHVYHYATYERTGLQKLSARHDTRIDEVDRLLRGGRLVDLYAVVRQGLRVSKESYSLKSLEAYYDPDARAGADVADAASSIVTYERWLADGDQRLLDAIERYNAVDCRSTQRLRDWLEGLRAQVVARGDELRRPADGGEGEPGEALAAANRAAQTLRESLSGASPGDDRVRLLGDLLDWHRREARAQWWDYFHRLTLSDEELVRDGAAVGQLGPGEHVRAQARSTIWRHHFPPQETKFTATDAARDRSGLPVGEITAIDAETGWLELKRATDRGPTVATSLVPGPPIPDGVLRDGVMHLAEDVLTRGIDAPGRLSAARDLLCRRPPRGPHHPLVGAAEPPAEAVARLATELRGGVLTVQGPPGSGKTHSAARMIIGLLAAGQRVGVCAFSHKAIGNLLDEVMVIAAREGWDVRALQKASGEQRCASSTVECTGSAADVVARLGELDVVAGTAWLFARADMMSSVDTLVIDEAGQMSLANVLAVAGSSDNLVLFGDPQQLAQPAMGMHPPGAQASALEHLLSGASTIDPALGVFLDRTWRMHPDICSFVSETSYDGRLSAQDDCAKQRVDAPGRLSGAGLRWVPVEHQDNSAASSEEASVVRALLDDLLRGSWTGADGVSRPLCLDDVLVIAPYNAQVGRLKQRLPAGARVGTVDKFQGQEAVVVIYSLASSSVGDAPRGVEFLYSRNRLNVAVSRARGLVAVVASPRLLDAPVRSPDQLALVNALCRLGELTEAG
ncbi:MAG: TM0106 family RecB-like putative nuclease, partial [Pseudonocardiales bacterium]